MAYQHAPITASITPFSCCFQEFYEFLRPVAAPIGCRACWSNLSMQADAAAVALLHSIMRAAVLVSSVTGNGWLCLTWLAEGLNVWVKEVRGLHGWMQRDGCELQNFPKRKQPLHQYSFALTELVNQFCPSYHSCCCCCCFVFVFVSEAVLGRFASATAVQLDWAVPL